MKKPRNPMLDFKAMSGLTELGRRPRLMIGGGEDRMVLDVLVVARHKSGDVAVAIQSGDCTHKIRRDEIVMRLSAEQAEWLKKTLGADEWPRFARIMLDMPKRKDKYGRSWQLPANELCATCGQPDSCGDCNHKKLRKSEVLFMGGTLAKREK